MTTFKRERLHGLGRKKSMLRPPLQTQHQFLLRMAKNKCCFSKPRTPPLHPYIIRKGIRLGRNTQAVFVHFAIVVQVLVDGYGVLAEGQIVARGSTPPRKLCVSLGNDFSWLYTAIRMLPLCSCTFVTLTCNKPLCSVWKNCKRKINTKFIILFDTIQSGEITQKKGKWFFKPPQ